MFNVAFTPDGTKLIAGTGDGTIRIYDVASGEVLRAFAGSDNSVFGVTVSPDGSLLATTSAFEELVRVWDLENGGFVQEIKMADSLQVTMRFSPDGNILALSGLTIDLEDLTLKAQAALYDTNSWQQIRSLPESSCALAARETIGATALSLASSCRRRDR